MQIFPWGKLNYQKGTNNMKLSKRAISAQDLSIDELFPAPNGWRRGHALYSNVISYYFFRGLTGRNKQPREEVGFSIFQDSPYLSGEILLHPVDKAFEIRITSSFPLNLSTINYEEREQEPSDEEYTYTKFIKKNTLEELSDAWFEEMSLLSSYNLGLKWRREKNATGNFFISKRALTEEEYEKQMDEEYEESQRQEQERYDSLTEEEKKLEDEFWEQQDKEFKAKELERQNKPKRNRSELTYEEIEMLAEMDPQEQEEYFNKYFTASSNFKLSKRAVYTPNLTWTKPTLESNIKELLNIAQKETISYDSLKRSFKHGVLRPLDKKIWNHLENTDSLQVRTLEDAIALAKAYGKNYRPIKNAFETEGSLPAPVVLETNDHSLILISGNIRLAFARAFYVKPLVYWIKETELYSSPESIDVDS